MNQEQIAYMQTWCAQQSCQLVTRGEVGFGRPCVGVQSGQSYLDFFWMEWNDDEEVRKQMYADERIQNFRRAAPEDAYHKHPCMAVLVHNDDYDKALQQLYTWIKYCEENGWGVITKPRETFNKSGFGRELELMMGGLTQSELRPL